MLSFALVIFRSPNQYTISIDPTFNQDQHQDNQHQDKQAKGSTSKEIEGISIKLYQKVCLVLSKKIPALLEHCSLYNLYWITFH